jgi:hypothetical protein
MLADVHGGGVFVVTIRAAIFPLFDSGPITKEV